MQVVVRTETIGPFWSVYVPLGAKNVVLASPPDTLSVLSVIPPVWNTSSP